MQSDRLSVVSEQTSSIKDQIQCSPYCFYHSGKQITHFCLHSSCILPLCQECVIIHRRQAINSEHSVEGGCWGQVSQNVGKHTSKIMPYKQVKEVAMQSIANELIQTNNASEQMMDKLGVFVKQLNECMKKQIEHIRSQLLLRYRFAEKKQEFESNLKAIHQGSLKQLIRHYEQGNVFIPASNPVQFQLNRDGISKTLWAMVTNWDGSSRNSSRVSMKKHSQQGHSQQGDPEIDEDLLTVGNEYENGDEFNGCRVRNSLRKQVRKSIFSVDFHKKKGIFVTSPKKEQKTQNQAQGDHRSAKSVEQAAHQKALRYQNTAKQRLHCNSETSLKNCDVNVSCKQKSHHNFAVVEKTTCDLLTSKQTDKLKIINSFTRQAAVTKLSIPFVEIKSRKTRKRSEGIQADEIWRKSINYSDVHAKDDNSMADSNNLKSKQSRNNSDQEHQPTLSQSRPNKTASNKAINCSPLRKIERYFNDSQILNPQQMRELMAKRRHKAEQASKKNSELTHNKQNQFKEILDRNHTTFIQ